MKRYPNTAFVLLLSAAIIALALSAHAAERITLKNGFTIDCDHHATVKNKLRLYLNKTEESYVELPPDDLVATETLPDLPPPIPDKIATAETPATPAATKDTHTRSKFNSQLNTADLHEILVRESAEHNVDVDLLASIVKAESGGNANAVSHAGAQGLMQLMPATAASHGVDNSFAPEQNVHGGSAYINELLTRYHDNLALALAAYNAGPAAVDKYKGIPPYAETRAYVAYVIHEFNRRVRAREALSVQGAKPLN